MELEIEYYEYECGGCDPTGCSGHMTDIPISITLDNVTFYVNGFWEGNFPDDKEEAEETKAIVKRLQTILQHSLDEIKTS